MPTVAYPLSISPLVRGRRWEFPLRKRNTLLNPSQVKAKFKIAAIYVTLTCFIRP
jgi:hypothetical protein